MDNLPGVFTATNTNGIQYYRSSITYQRKHISLGSFTTQELANKAYLKASSLLTDSDFLHYTVEDHKLSGFPLSFDKWVMLINLRDNGMYCRNPIYLKHKYFIYYLDIHTPLKFDVDDLFYYMKHKIMRRGGHLFVSEYGMQVNILSRYGIKNYAVAGRDFRYVNGDSLDYRYRNIHVLSRYHGVIKDTCKGRDIYLAKIHIKGDIIIGRYTTEVEAGIAYNKAASLLKSFGVNKDFPENYIDELNEIEYAKIFNSVRISKRIRNYLLT